MENKNLSNEHTVVIKTIKNATDYQISLIPDPIMATVANQLFEIGSGTFSEWKETKNKKAASLCLTSCRELINLAKLYK